MKKKGVDERKRVDEEEKEWMMGRGWMKKKRVGERKRVDEEEMSG